MRNELKRMISGKGFWIAVLIGTVGIVSGYSWIKPESLLEPGSFLRMTEEAIEGKAICFLLPVLSVLPWSDSFLGEWKGGFLKACLPRVGRRAYVESRVLTVLLGGLLSALTAASASLFLRFVLFFPLEQQGNLPVGAVWSLAEVALRLGVLAGILASLGALCAVVTGSSYLAFGLPLVGWYFCMILQERYFADALWLYPPQWISGAAQWGGQGEGLWLFLALFLAVTAGAHAGVLYARLEEI